MTQRIQMIAKALMLYNVWYPEYEGFDLTMITTTEPNEKKIDGEVAPRVEEKVKAEYVEMIREAEAWIEQKKINV